MTQNASKGLWILSESPEASPSGTRSGGYTGPDFSGKGKETSDANFVETEVLKHRMDEFLSTLEEVFDKAEKKSSKMQLDEIELSIEITGEGQIRLLGSGTKVGGKGAISLKFKRTLSEP